MKKKIFSVFAAIIIAIPLLTITVFGATPRWTFFNSATALCIEEDDAYYASATAGRDVVQLDLSAVLYEKGLFTSYTEVARTNKTVYTYYATLNGSYSYSSLKSYKIVLTATAYTSSGQTETITVSEEY